MLTLASPRTPFCHCVLNKVFIIHRSTLDFSMAFRTHECVHTAYFSVWMHFAHLCAQNIAIWEETTFFDWLSGKCPETCGGQNPREHRDFIYSTVQRTGVSQRWDRDSEAKKRIKCTRNGVSSADIPSNSVQCFQSSVCPTCHIFLMGSFFNTAKLKCQTFLGRLHIFTCLSREPWF